MKKLLFLFLALPFFFASCSSDDKDDVEPEIGTFKIEVKTISYNKISLDWNKVSEAYSYQVFYKAEGASKWETSNSIMPIDNGMTVHWNGDFASFASDTKYSVQVKAFRDSRDGSVIAESNILEIKTLTEDRPLIVGKWKQIYLRAVAETSDAELTTFIEKEYLKDYKGISQYEFFDNKTFVYEHTENPDVWVDKYLGQYSIKNDIITFLYTDKNGVKVEDMEMVKFAIGESDFYIVRDLDEKEYENILNIFNSSTPVEQLVINKVTFEYVYTRVQ